MTSTIILGSFKFWWVMCIVLLFIIVVITI